MKLPSIRLLAAGLGTLIVAVVVLAGILAPWITPYDPFAHNLEMRMIPPSFMEGGNPAHFFGTDQLGRDILSRVIYGGRLSLPAGLAVVLVAGIIGTAIGALAGWAGGWTDTVISRLTDAALSCPFLILAIALAAFLGPALSNAMIAIGISACPIFVRVARGATMAAKVEDYIEAARAVGNPARRILGVHILPNIAAPVLVQATLTIAGAIIAEASLSFLGLGQQPPAPSWGSMLNSAQRFLEQAPWLAVFPGLSIFLVVLGFNLLGDGLRDALDPRRD